MSFLKRYILFIVILMSVLSFSSCRTVRHGHYDDTESLAVVATGAVGPRQNTIPLPSENEQQTIRKINWNSADVSAIFDDKQAVQLPSAQANGIEPLETDRGISLLVRQGRIVEIRSNEHYSVAKLTHSYPYLTPKAARMIDAIGKRVQQLTGTKSRIVYTSLLRTKRTQRKLGTRNANAAQFSCHFFGTTFDISYTTFEADGCLQHDVYKALCQAVYEMQQQRKLWVKYEHAQHCLHCTIR